MPMASLDICANQQFVVSCGADTAVSLRYSSLSGTERAPLTFAHDLESGGASHIKFDVTGRHVVSAGVDGSVFVFNTPGTGHVVAAPTAVRVAPLEGDEEVDSPDAPSQPSIVAQLKLMKFEAAQKASEQQRLKIQERLSRLKVSTLGGHWYLIHWYL